MYEVIYKHENSEFALKDIDLTKEKAIELHRSMWERINSVSKRSAVVVDINALKSEYLYERNMLFVRNRCFCCEYAEQNALSCSTGCLFNWNRNSDEKFVSCGLGIYGEAVTTTNVELQRSLINKIANLPVRTDI